MARDYSNFVTLAKRCFLPVAEELGYEQISGIEYFKKAGDWYESFNLQIAGHGNDFFYVNFGIVVPNLYPLGEELPIRECGMLLGSRLRDVDNTGGFGRENKAAVIDSAARVLIQYQTQARQWFDGLTSWEAITAEYLRVNPIEESKLGLHTTAFGEDLRSATYGYLLLKAGLHTASIRWLREAERLLSLPVYCTRDGRFVHEKEKFARLQKPEPGYIEQLQHVRSTLAFLKGLGHDF